MEKQFAKSRKLFLAIGAVVIWFSVIAQLYLMLINRSTPLSEVLIRFFSYFTIQTNILAGTCLTTLLLGPTSVWGNFFSGNKVLAAICSYIAFVGIAYSVLLRSLWQPTGLQLVVDELLHSVNPTIFILFWLIFVSKTGLEWKNVMPWLIYPILYFVYILIRGALSGAYPYPFVDVNEIGYKRMFINDLGLIIAFSLLSLVFIAIGKMSGRKYRDN